MLYLLKIRLTSPLLGGASGQMEDGVPITRFFRCGRDGILIDTTHWNWAVRQGAKSLSLAVKPESIRMPESFVAPTLGLYPRKKRRLNGDVSIRRFECIPSGTVLSWHVELVPPEGEDQDPAAWDVGLLISYIGRWFGLSQWGRDHNFGRFELISLEPLDPHDPSSAG